MVRLFRDIAALAAALCLSCAAYAQITREDIRPAMDSINSYLATKADVAAEVMLDTFFVKQHTVELHLNRAITDYPLRDQDIEAMKHTVRCMLPARYIDYKVVFMYRNAPIDRYSSAFLSGRRSGTHVPRHGRQWVSGETSGNRGLSGYNIALWASHGYYYSAEADRWQWQRAPFFTSVEDLLTQGYVTEFLAPMLENAGAYVIMPRERDTMTEEIIVDNGSPFYSEKGTWSDAPGKGFGGGRNTLTSGENPFETGSARTGAYRSASSPKASYRPHFPKSGDYAVYVSYKTLPTSTLAEYTVTYSGGERHFTVDQRMGGGTWVYLGTFRFTAGESEQGVTVNGIRSESDGDITTDAVRFGGGMGNILRGQEVSGMPRYAEGARYWLQWSGFPDTVYSLNKGKDDYRDDFMCRGEWVNDLCGRLGVPVDMALALHTDAGVFTSDSIVGTLAIYKEESEGSRTYSNGRARITARELADIVQSSIVEDIRTCYRPDWNRRAIWDRSYMEARVPDVPTVLIELLAHQNFSDMQCALDPEFKFIVSRAIYKGILKYLSFTSGTDYIVQPLPVTDMCAVINEGGKRNAELRLTWAQRTDRTEPTATADSYIVYRRVVDPSDRDGNIPGFDNGITVNGTEYTDRIDAGLIYSYKVVAVNEGGRSFPSEILSAGYLPDSRCALVVNGFTEVSAPASYTECDSSFAGFDFKQSHGVPYLRDISYIGEQYEYRRDRPWIHDDLPGFGASYMDYGPAPVAGNTFDYPLVHGTALMRSGMSFCSTSLSALLSGKAGTSYPLIDMFFGNSMIPSSDSLFSILSGYCGNGGSLLLSGSAVGKSIAYDYDMAHAHTGSIDSALHSINDAAEILSSLKESVSSMDKDLTGMLDSTVRALKTISGSTAGRTADALDAHCRSMDPVYAAYAFASDVLHSRWSNSFATSTGKIRSVANSMDIYSDSTAHIAFDTRPNPRIYCVTCPDALIPADSRACTFLRYEGSNTSAGIAYDGTYRCVTLGFPIEALTSQQQVDGLMREVIDFLIK